MDRSSLPTSSSKVTAQCVDPSDLFSTFKPLLLQYLPLRNLHWKSPNRPLRSINTLHVDVIKDGNESASIPERRHQIPGLRQTPYLKIYLLRCDDNETYKATCRKQIREWIKSNAQQAENNTAASNQEKHDAFEWLIVHVVFPETPAAAQLWKSKEARLGTTDSSDSITNKSKWPGKGSSNVFEKLRADFNGSSKSAVERVAQIRVPNAGQQISAEMQEQFLDLVEKLKLTILSSFDLRVSQYEEDIREKDSQRILPGWNFNTFFVLKEGLARGFENVGLFEDALVVYDELALGLDIIVHEQLEVKGSDHGGRFLPYSDELKDKIQACLKDTNEGTGENARPKLDLDADPAVRLQRRDYPLDASRSPFRELILANDISIFDFRLYIFSRQLDLLLRSANARSIADEPSESQAEHSELEEHFLPLADACQRTLDFVTNGTRTLRHDLELALEMNEVMSTDERHFRSSVISNFILSWMYVSSLQVLAQTSSPGLILPSAEAMPSRTISKSSSRFQASNPTKFTIEPSPSTFSRTPSPTRLDLTARSARSGDGLAQPSSTLASRTGAEELAGARAELYLLARAAVQQIGDQHGWKNRWSVHGLAEVQNEEAAERLICPVINGLQHLDLRSIFHSKKSFKMLFGCLTTFSYRHLLAAKRTNSAEKAIAELAVLKYEAGEYESGASYLGRIASYYSDAQWPALEATFLELYASCMKELGRHGEYVSSLLRLLGQVRRSQQTYPFSSVDRYLADLWLFSEHLTNPVSAKFSDFFSIRRLAPYIHHHQDRDGFFIYMDLAFIGASVEVPNGLQMTLSSTHESTPSTITLHSQPIKIVNSPIRVELNSSLSILGWYAIDKLELKIGNILFIENYKDMFSALVDQPKLNHHRLLRFFIYPPFRSLQATACPAHYLHLAQPRSMQIEMKTGWNEIQACTLSMKSGTPGLRLRLHDAKVQAANGLETPSLTGHRESTQAIQVTHCPADSEYKFLIPYTVENADIPVISARLDIEYSTAKGNFLYSSVVAINTILPVSVNVQDLFKENALFSRFTISPATLVPLRLWRYEMQSSEETYSIESHADNEDAMDVFPKQPASLIYKVTRLQPTSVSRSGETPLALSVKFSCLDEVVLKVIEQHFIASVTAGPVASLAQPLCAHLLSTFRSQWSALDLEVICLCHEIEIWPFEDLCWEAVLKGFDIKTSGLAKTWLQEWHQHNVIIPIYSDLGGSDPPSRQIVIPVDIPKPPIVVTTSLYVDSRHTEAVTIGEALLADLQISVTRDWAAAESLAEKDVQLQISFEVLAPPDDWTIGGTRKGRLPAQDPVQSMPVILLPQRTGHLLLPSVEVKCYKVETLEGDGPSSEGTRVPCEVDLRSLAQSVHVVSGMKETVVEIGVDAEATNHTGSEKRTWLVGSKGRETAMTNTDRIQMYE
ncbi:hypothetical protein GJ744_010287 [Endocarpon pusillum]|uniref:Trafficking protein particle complex subunit 10 n=1 Tax=Endocarpon pusillum TaxID=364733 RepID=A0A8H7AGU1_9EURO|nr:hypothetical protein GJ744_010287 [Endocarpon pusillum]